MDFDESICNAYNSEDDIFVMEGDVQKKDKGSRYSKDGKQLAKGGLKLKFKVGDSYKMFSTEQVNELIEHIEDNPQLWDKRHNGYKDKAAKSKTWHTIEKNLGFLVVDRGYRLQKVWMALVGAYRRQKEILKGRSGTGLEEIKTDFEYFEKMQFVESAFCSSAPPPTADSTRNITKRIVDFEKEEGLPSRKYKRSGDTEFEEEECLPRRKYKKSGGTDEIIELFKTESRSIDKSIESLMQSLKEDKEVKRQSYEHQDIVDKISNTLKSLHSSDVFECKVALSQVCDSFMRRFNSHNSYTFNGSRNVNMFEQMGNVPSTGMMMGSHIGQRSYQQQSFVSPSILASSLECQNFQNFEKGDTHHSSNQLAQPLNNSDYDEFREFFVPNE